MTKPIDALQMAHDAGFEEFETEDSHWLDCTPWQLLQLVSEVLERAAIECEQSEAYRGSVFAQRIRALKPSQGQADTLEAEDKQ